jgi:hypothetical protein
MNGHNFHLPPNLAKEPNVVSTPTFDVLKLQNAQNRFKIASESLQNPQKFASKSAKNIV